MSEVIAMMKSTIGKVQKILGNVTKKRYKYTLLKGEEPSTDLSKSENVAWKMLAFLALSTIIVYSINNNLLDFELEIFSDGNLTQIPVSQPNLMVSDWTPTVKFETTKATTKLPTTRFLQTVQKVSTPTTEKYTTSISQNLLNSTTGRIFLEGQTISISTPKIQSQKITHSVGIKKIWKPENFYVFTAQCHMPRLDPFSRESKKIFKPGKYKECGEKAIVSSVFNEMEKRYILNINEKKSGEISCCYQHVVRSGSGANADKKFKLLPCVNFNSNFTVPQHIDAMLIECKSRKTKKSIQKDAFSFIQERKETTPFVDSKNSSRKPNVIMIGIDSLSRSNFRRNMPKTANFLIENAFFELEGYNKVGDNTFPNLMPLLTGFNESKSYSKCNPKIVGGLDKCDFIWTDFKAHRYATAYAEDECSMSTFNYIKKGFQKSPTDYYLRPMMLAAEKNMKIQKKSALVFCIGRKHSAEYIYDFGLEFAKRFRLRPGFGFFWTNSFSHNAFDTSSTMDIKMLEYLERMKNSGVLDTSIVIFFSDHGMRWGPLLKLSDGFLEERLPMFFISLPKWFQEQHADYVKALKINRNRLTTPFDIYRTLKHILKLTMAEANQTIVDTAASCPKAQSIFLEVPEDRSCKEACIPEHWCTCKPYEVLSTKNSAAIKVADLIINEMNHFLNANNFSSLCSSLKRSSIDEVHVRMEDPSAKPLNETFRIKFKVNPKKAQFEATALYDLVKHSIHVVIENISRLDSYAPYSKCIDNKLAKKFCMCK